MLHMRTMVLEYAHQHLPKQNHPVIYIYQHHASHMGNM